MGLAARRLVETGVRQLLVVRQPQEMAELVPRGMLEAVGREAPPAGQDPVFLAFRPVPVPPSTTTTERELSQDLIAWRRPFARNAETRARLRASASGDGPPGSSPCSCASRSAASVSVGSSPASRNSAGPARSASRARWNTAAGPSAGAAAARPALQLLGSGELVLR